MLFNSFHFVAFFIIVYAVYVNLGHRWQNRLLLAASAYFYGSWSWRFAALLAFSIVIDYSVALGLERLTSQRRRKFLLYASLVNRLALLGVFKYYNFFVDNFSLLLSHVGINANSLYLNLILPIGISFYTFHSISYVVDVYQRKLKACASLVDYALFVAYFPQLVAGPIARACELLPQIQNPRKLSSAQLVGGLYLIGWGLFQKLVVADGCGILVKAVFEADASYSGLDKLLAVYAFAFQIYGDFAGYSNVARGVSKLLGIELMLNFNLPYFATSPPDFWRRWHISLSTWLRDYLYVPLGGNRGGTLQTCRNLMLTMLLGGIWHGAAWTMVLWGAYHGGILIVHRLVCRSQGAARLTAASAWRILIMFHATCLGWLIFRAESLAQIGRFLRDIVLNLRPSVHTSSFAALLLQLVVPFILLELWKFKVGDTDIFVTGGVKRRLFIFGVLAASATAFVVFHRTLLQSEIPFIYFQF